MWSHAIGTAGAARKIAEIKAFEEASHCFSAGLLHDMGKIILIKLFPDRYQKVIESFILDKGDVYLLVIISDGADEVLYNAGKLS